MTSLLGAFDGGRTLDLLIRIISTQQFVCVGENYVPDESHIYLDDIDPADLVSGLETIAGTVSVGTFRGRPAIITDRASQTVTGVTAPTIGIVLTIGEGEPDEIALDQYVLASGDKAPIYAEANGLGEVEIYWPRGDNPGEYIVMIG